MRNKIKNLGLNVILLFVVLFIIEIGLRLINVTGRNQEEKLIPITPNDLTYKDYRPNSTFVIKPNSNDEFKELTNHINSIGIRGPELKKKKGIRVLNIGDSFVQADEVEFDKTFGERLNKEFKDSIEFISHGISSWAPTPMFSWIIHKGIDLQPDEINLFLCINDFYRQDVLYTSDANYRKAAVYENGLPVKYRVNNNTTPINILASLELVRLPVLVYKNLRADYKITNSTHNKTLTNSTHGKTLIVQELKLLEKTDSLWTEKFKNEIDNTLEVIVKMHDFLDSNNINLNVYMIPLGFSWENESIGGKLAYGMKEKEITTQVGFDNYLFEILNNKYNINTHLLYQDINAYKMRNYSEKLYFNFDGHWNNNGHRVIGQIISNNIKKNK